MKKLIYLILILMLIILLVFFLLNFVTLNTIALIYCISWTFINMIIILVTFIKKDKELIPNFDETYFRNMPEDCIPAVAGYLINEKNVKLSDFKATILDLIRKKHIIYDKDLGLLTRTYISFDYLANSEIFMLNLLFNIIGNTKVVSLKNLSNYSMIDAPEDFRVYYYEWAKLVEEESSRENFFEESKYSAYSLLVIFIPTIVSLLAFNYGFMFNTFVLKYMFYLFMFSIPVTMYVLFAQKKTRKGIELYSKIMALKKYLSDFSVMEEKEIEHLKLWDKYLIYATMFNLTPQIYNLFDIGLIQHNKNGTYFIK